MKAFRKNRRPGNRAQTARESAWVDMVKRHGCVCCIRMGYPHDPDGAVVEAHHLLHAGLRIGHGFTVGLCAWHHRRQLIVMGWDFAAHREKLGPSLLDGSKTFERRFGDNHWLLCFQHDILEAAGA